MRDQVRELIADSETPWCECVGHAPGLLYVRCCPLRTLEPAAILRDPIRVNDTAPQERWDVDLLEGAGVLRLERLVANIKAVCQAIV
jgi:hypothetical protein